MASKTYKKPTIFRAGVVKGFDQKPEISREGGEFGAGFIKNFAVITKGEALGHGAWVDDTFVAQVAEQLAFAKKGIKARYTHPNQCGDSLSKGLGRVFYRLSEDGKVRGDLHFWKAAHKTPDGDLAGFLIDMAEDDPEAFGASISFMQDVEAMEQFSLENPESPDPLNVNNYPHVRLGKLRFCDIVDEPAANPDGLFHRGGEVTNAESIMEYALGIREDRPSDCETIFGIESDRLLNFVSTFLNTRGLQVVSIEESGSNEPIVEEVVEVVETPEVEEVVETPEVEEVVETPEVEEVVEAPEVEEAPEQELDPEAPRSPVGKGHFSKEELGQYIENFGSELGVEYFMGDIDLAAAQADYIGKQKNEIEALKAQIELSEQTEDAPLSGQNGEPVVEKKK